MNGVKICNCGVELFKTIEEKTRQGKKIQTEISEYMIKSLGKNKKNRKGTERKIQACYLAEEDDECMMVPETDLGPSTA